MSCDSCDTAFAEYSSGPWGPPRRRRSGPSLFVALLLVIAIAAACSGCSALDELPDGAQLQTHTFGIKVSPQALDGTPLAVGSHTTIITTAQPVEAGPNVNRSEIQAPMGIRVKSTVASGPVGDQLEAAGGVAAIESLVNGQPPAVNVDASEPVTGPANKVPE
ncbi:MAG: hypothetical protein ACYTGL_13930 [Planctomycetota bacterium]